MLHIYDISRLRVKLAEASVQSTTGSRSVRISGSNAGYIMFRGSVATHSIRQFPLRFPCPASPCAITFQLDSTEILSRGGKAAECVVDRSSSAELKNEWSCTSVTRICIHCRDRDDFTFTSVGLKKCIV